MGEPSFHGFKAESGTGELVPGSLGERWTKLFRRKLAVFAATRSQCSNPSINILISKKGFRAYEKVPALAAGSCDR